MTRHAANRAELTVSDALQEYADDTKGERKLTKQFRKWRFRSILGGTAVALVGLKMATSLFGGGEAPAVETSDQGHVSGGNASASATEDPSKSKERQALECALDEVRGTKMNGDGSASVEVVLKTEGGDGVEIHAVPYTAESISGGDLSFTAASGGVGSVAIPGSLISHGTEGNVSSAEADANKKLIGFYAEAGDQIDACGSIYVSGDDGVAHYGDPTGDDLPAYHQ